MVGRARRPDLALRHQSGAQQRGGDGRLTHPAPATHETTQLHSEVPCRYVVLSEPSRRACAPSRPRRRTLPFARHYSAANISCFRGRCGFPPFFCINYTLALASGPPGPRGVCTSSARRPAAVLSRRGCRPRPAARGPPIRKQETVKTDGARSWKRRR